METFNMDEDLRTQDAYNAMATNYNNLTPDKQGQFVQDLGSEYGAETANAIVKTFTPNMDAYNDYLRITESLFPENQPLTDNVAGPVSVATNYNIDSINNEGGSPAPQMAQPANFNEGACPVCGSNPCVCQAQQPQAAPAYVDNGTSIEDSMIIQSVDNMIRELQAMPPEAASQVIAQFQAKVDEDQSFSEGLTLIYNEKGSKDFSRDLSNLVARYYRNLNSMRRDGYSDFSETQAYDLYEYNCMRVPSDFSLLRTTAKIACQIKDFSDDLDTQAPRMMSNVMSAIDQGQAQNLAHNLDELYDALPSEEAKQYMMTKLMSLIQNPDPNASMDMAELVPENLGGTGEPLPEGEGAEPQAENPDPTEAEIDAQLSNSDQVKALIEKYKSLNNDAERAAMKAAMENHPGIGPQVAEYVVKKAEGQEFSEEALPEGQVASGNAGTQDVPPTAPSLEEMASDNFGEPDLGMTGVEVMDEKLETNDPANVKDTTFNTGSLEGLASVVDGDIFADELAAPEGSNSPSVKTDDFVAPAPSPVEVGAPEAETMPQTTIDPSLLE